MTAECRDLDLHEGEERQRSEQRVQLFGALDVENGDVRIATCYPPEVPPFALPL